LEDLTVEQLVGKMDEKMVEYLAAHLDLNLVVWSAVKMVDMSVDLKVEKWE
jgi:hypothetical protein